ncbi:sensory transduction histidine kinase [Rubripirellula lacrimiformis]|nr:sensory transduction histidine kinase [Rubripirellula lacrimiformis]
MIQMIWGQVMKEGSSYAPNTGCTSSDPSKEARKPAEGHSTSLTRIYARVDRIFCAITAVQTTIIFAVAMIVPPSRWLESDGLVGLSIWLSLTLGTLVCVIPSALTFRFAGQPIVRHSFAVAQVAWSAILIHLCGGIAAVQLCILVSLALLSLYRDVRVLLTASFISGADYLIRSNLWPQSLYGDRVMLPYEWLEHLNWLILTTGFFALTSHRSHQDVQKLCKAEQSLDTARTELASRDKVEDERQKAAAEKETAICENALNSAFAGSLTTDPDALQAITAMLKRISFSINLLHEKAAKSRVTTLVKASRTLNDRKEDLADYLTKDSRGTHFPSMLAELTQKLSSERDDHQRELQTIQKTVQTLSQLIGNAVTPNEKFESCEK